MNAVYKGIPVLDTSWGMRPEVIPVFSAVIAQVTYRVRQKHSE